ncbi:MAG: hypothetical protein AB7Q64_23370 [Verrucomicrobiales bacterium]|nr:hypothetical protein [Verrucomicrobiae bacterium]
MKKLVFAFTLLAGFGLIATPSAEARGHHHSSARSVAHYCGSCGSAVYRERVVIRRTECGDPVYGWRTAGHHCASRRGVHRHGQVSPGHGHERGGHGERRGSRHH